MVHTLRSLLSQLAHGAARTILFNAGSLMGTTLVTSALGFAYWWLAARQLPADAVGFGSAAISAMLLLGTLSVLGLGTLLIGELPRQPERRGALITSALFIVSSVGLGLGLLFALLAPPLSAEFRHLSDTGGALVLAIGVSLTALTFVLDQAVIGLLRGELQFWRNAVFAATKLLLLVGMSLWLVDRSWFAVYNTWALGNLLSLLVIAARAGVRLRLYRPDWHILRELRQAALAHHMLNLALQISYLTLPVVVTVLLSAEVNGSFYIAWLIANLVLAVPFTLTTALYAVGAAARNDFSKGIRLTLPLATAVALATNAVLWLGADHIMALFGRSYAEQVADTLRILALGAFPIIIKDHFIAVGRVEAQIQRTAFWVTIGGIWEVAIATLGASVAGLFGLSVGWVLALCLEAIVMAPTVWRVTTSVPLAPWRAPLPEPAARTLPAHGQAMLVSIIIDNYNYGRFLGAAIESALRQTHPHVEVIVVDDGSNDNSRAVIESYGTRVRPIFKANGGQASALNAGFAQSRGEMIIFLDSDDVLCPETAAQVCAAKQQTPHLARVHYRMEVLDAAGKPTGVLKPFSHWPLPAGDLRRHVMSFPADLAWLPTSGNAFSAAVLQRIMPIPVESFRILADSYLLHVSALFGPVISLPSVGAYYRVHGFNHYEVVTLNLHQVRQTIVHWHAAHLAVQQHALALGLQQASEVMRDSGSVAYVANKMISLKLEPEQHPFREDSVSRIWRQGIAAVRRRFDVYAPMKVLYCLWFCAMRWAPPPLARQLAQVWLFPGSRGPMNEVLRRLHRGYRQSLPKRLSVELPRG